MIKYSDLVARIRTECPVFQNRVGASVAYQTALNSSADLATPHCFVMPVDFKDFSLIEYDEAYPDSLKVKVTRETFMTIIVVDNRENRGAKDGGTNSIAPLDLLAEIQEALEKAFAGWKPASVGNGAGDINLSGGQYQDSDNCTLWYSFEWSILYRRGPGSLTDEQVAEIDQIIYGNDEAFKVETIKTVSSNTHPSLQPVANELLDRNEFPDGLPDPDAMEDAETHLDRDETWPEGENYPKDEDIAEHVSSSEIPIVPEKGIFNDQEEEAVQ